MFGFAQPWFLLTALAAGVPLALHLMKRETLREHLFPSIRFILKGRVPQGGRRRLRDILLLLLRMLTILLLALLLARPYRKLAPGNETGRDRVAVAVVDLSASMATAQRMETAKQELTSLIDETQHTRWFLLSSANGIIDELEPDAGIGATRSFIDKLQAGTVAGNHSEALTRAVTLLAENGGTELYIISDFQAADWQLETLPSLPDGILPYFVNVGDASQENVGITRVRCRQAGDGLLQIAVEIQNFGTSPESRSVRLQTGNNSFDQEIEIPGTDSAKTVFQIETGGSEIGLITLSGDSYDRDDSYRLWLGAPSPFTLLAVPSSQDSSTSATELFFLQKALAVTTPESAVPYNIEVASPTSFFALDLSSVDGLLMLGGTASLEEPGYKQVKKFLVQGGVVLCTASPDAPSRQLINLARHGLLAAQFKGMFISDERSAKKRAIGWLNQFSAIGRIFENVQDSDLFIMQIRQMIDIKTVKPVEEIIRTEDEHPLLVRQMVGSGDFYFMATSLTTRATDLPVSMAFLPIIREIFAARNGGLDTDGIVRIDCGNPVPVRKTLAGETLRVPDDWDSVNYQATPRAGKIADMPIEMNVPRSESMPNRRSAVAMRVAMTGKRTAPDRLATSAGQQIDLRPHAALLMMLTVIAEILLTGRGDKRERQGRIQA